MKRWILLAAFAVVLSTAATVAVQFMGVSTSPASPVYPVGTKAASKTGATGASPRAVLEGDPTYLFGTLPQRTTGKHTWVVRNEGEAELVLWMISSTCSCTLAKFKNGEKATVPPGQSTEIVLEYETRENNGTYEKGAEIGTNDPNLSQFSLHVKGQVFPAIMTYPGGNVVNFHNIVNDVEDNKQFIAVFSRDRDLKILKATSSRPRDITVDLEPLPPKEAKQILGQERGGYKLTIHASSALPLGNFREKVVLKTDHPMQPELPLDVVGKMSGPVNLQPGSLIMHQINGRAGGRGELTVSVRANRETKIEVEKAPQGVDVSVVPVENAKGRYHLRVVVPPGTPPREIEDDIVLRTDHPMAGRVTVPISLWIQNAP